MLSITLLYGVDGKMINVYEGVGSQGTERGNYSTRRTVFSDTSFYTNHT
jgi:hypothetical protein